ncbi:helix-turn-helix domain-containing protein [Breoghania sp.]|uniref:GlxA family transcriptional regulator n=1 Tax=Breoghania sp. TaxID=2065378 RepID=UPI002AAAF492|nr:helix-turn-helix domain-containing protein [Breoghania sp.]
MKVTFLLFEGFSNLVLSCLLEPIRMLRELYQDEIEWRVVTPTDGPVPSSSNLHLTPNARIEDIEASDLLVVISSNGYRQHPTPENQRLVMQLVRQSQIVVGADAGVWLLASTGLLDELTVTMHWAIMSEFAETYPHIQVTQEKNVMEGKFWSCGGASTALDLSLAFIKERFGPAKAYMASSMFTSDGTLQRQEERTPTALHTLRKGRVEPVISIMAETIEHPLSLPALAERAHISPRSLNRLFRAELGMSPGQYYQQLRLSNARELSENTDLDLREIAFRCGYADAASLTKAFRRVFGQPIRQYQKTIHPANTRPLFEGSEN